MERVSAVQAVLGRRVDVRLAYLFGSAARGQSRTGSALDIAVLFDLVPGPPELDALTADVEAAAGRRVDLVVLNTAPPLLAHQVVATGRRLVCRAAMMPSESRSRRAPRAGISIRRTSAACNTGISVSTSTPTVPVHPDVLRRKLLDISETVSRLRGWLPITMDQLAGDVMLRWAVEHGLHLAAEALFDSGNHILAGEFQEAADEYREVPRRLAARRVISTATADRLESLAGFRNGLVHEYAAVDVRRVHAGLDRLDDFEAFVADVEDWLGRSGR